MKTLISLLVLIVFGFPSFGQSKIDVRCLNELNRESNNLLFPTYNNHISIKGDTIRFDKSEILLRNSCDEAFLIFRRGLLFPELILGASTDRYGKRNKTSAKFIGVISLSSFKEMDIPVTPTKRCFSFLLWRKGLANPLLYVLQLPNEKANRTTSLTAFIAESRVTAFGFCSILI